MFTEEQAKAIIKHAMNKNRMKIDPTRKITTHIEHAYGAPSQDTIVLFTVHGSPHKLYGSIERHEWVVAKKGLQIGFLLNTNRGKIKVNEVPLD